MTNQIFLPNGNKMSRPSVYPKNWKTGGKSLLKKEWYIQYYYYQKNAEKPTLKIIKGMNTFKTLEKRRAVTRMIIDDEINANQNGYNPVTKTYMRSDSYYDSELHPNMHFIDAFRTAASLKDCSATQKKQFKWMIDRLEESSKKLPLAHVTINNLKRRNLKQILDRMKLPPVLFNRYKQYLSSLYAELIEFECCDVNIVRDIRSKKFTRKQRTILSPSEFKTVMNYLKDYNYQFWRYAMIFAHSGARSSELRSLKKSDVNLQNQEYTVLIKKGNQYKETKKVILKSVIYLWEEVMSEAADDQYLFGPHFIPGDQEMHRQTITKYWYRHVKNGKIKDEDGELLEVKADFYALKHALLDSLPPEVARILASHTTMSTTAIYQVNKEKRERQKLKDLDFNMLRVV